MEYLFLVLLVLLLAYIVYRNFGLFSRYNNNKDYINCYKAMLNKEENAYENICRYIEASKADEFKNKGRILKLYHEIDEGLDYQSTLDELDLFSIFSKNGKFSKEMFTNNTDVFVWLNMVLAKARSLSKFDVLNVLYDKVNAISEADNYVECQLFKAIYNAMLEKEDGGAGFMSNLLEGNYTDYLYDKTLIGMFKRFAAATLAYSGEPLEDYYRNDLADFSTISVGRAYMKDLGIYSKYKMMEKNEEE